MINNSEKAFDIIKNISKEFFPDCRVLLFGSRTRPGYSDSSDYDFLIITKDTIDVQQKRLYKSLLRKKLAEHKIPADILIHSESEIVTKGQITGHIVREIMKEGVPI